MSTGSALTTTSYAVLGLLSVRPWSTYELTRQMDQSLGRIWPRARSKLYEEPKKLVAHGLAAASTETVGRRPRTVYTITGAGRAALASWLAEPGKGPVLESEQLLKIFFAEAGTRADALATLDATREWARERNEQNLAAARAYAAGEGPFQHRAARTMLVGAFLTDFYAMVARWSQWAREQVEGWPDAPGDAEPDLAELERIATRARWSVDQVVSKENVSPAALEPENETPPSGSTNSASPPSPGMTEPPVSEPPVSEPPVSEPPGSPVAAAVSPVTPEP
jgi:PadR family transcriptional regulator, regulatory protein AphA